MASRVTCTTKGTDRITHLKGVNDDGSKFGVSEADAIEGIKSKGWAFYVLEGSTKVKVIIAKRNGVEYLKTENDGENENNLLSLPDCP